MNFFGVHFILFAVKFKQFVRSFANFGFSKAIIISETCAESPG